MPKTTLLRKQVTPTGTIQPHAGGTAPDGFLVCDGTIVDIADYPKLYAVIGTSWGYGNNDGLTFHLPDLRGRFLRGVDGAAGRDPDSGARTPSNTGGNSGDAVGSVQDDNFKEHTHTITTYDTAFGGSANIQGYGASVRDAPSTNATGGAETRPKNVAVNMFIKINREPSS